MKTLIKLAIFAIIVAFAVNYVNTNNVKLKAKVKNLFADLVTKYDEFAIKLESGNSTKSDSSYNSNNNSTLVQYKTTTDEKILDNHNSNDDREDFDVTGTTEYSEVMIPNVYDCLKTRFEEQDLQASNAPDYRNTTIENLVKQLVKPYDNDIEKARVIFTWIAKNISYDDDGYNSGNYGDCTPDGVFSSGKAVCQGYSELFEHMGKLAGLQIVTVTGYAKGVSYRVGSTFSDTNHAWNAIKIDGKWRLFDATWASGYGMGVNGKLKSFKKFSDYWFDTEPQAFIFSHLPEDSRWQFCDVTISKSMFEQFPFVQNNYFEMGFDGASCLQKVLNGSLTEFPKAYSMENISARVVSAPYQKQIPSEKPFVIKVNSNNASDIAVINNGRWAHLKRSGKEFSGVFKPHSGSLSIDIKSNSKDHTYSTMLEYVVN